MVGVAGTGLTTTLVVPAGGVRALSVVVTEYVPAFAAVALGIVGFCRFEVKPFGPVHEYVAGLTVGVLSEVVPPGQPGPLLLSGGGVGGAGPRRAAVDGDGNGVDAAIGDHGVRTGRVLLIRGEAVRAGPRVRGAGDGRRAERDGRAFAVRAVVAGGRRRRRGVDDDVGRAGGRGAAVHGDGHGVRAGIGGRGVRARRVLQRRGETIGAGPRVGRAAHGRCGKRDRGARAVRAAVARRRRGGDGVDDDVGRAGGRGAAVDGDGDGVGAGIGGGRIDARRVLQSGGEAVRAGPRVGRAAHGRCREGNGRAGAVRAAVARRRRRGDRVDDDVGRAGGRSAAVDGDRHRVRAGIGGRGIRTRRVLLRGGEAVRTRPRIRRAGDERGRERDRGAGAVRAAVARGGRRGDRVDDDVGRAGGRGAAVDRDGHRVRAGISSGGVRACRILERRGEAVRAGPCIRRAADKCCRERDRRAFAVRAAVARRRRGGDRGADSGGLAGGGGTAVDRDGHGVRAGIGGRGVRARRFLQRRGEAIRAGPRVGRAAHGRCREGNGRAGAVRTAVARGGRCGSGI